MDNIWTKFGAFARNCTEITLRPLTKGILTLYKAQIRPHLEYSTLAWLSCTQPILNKLDKIQHRALRLVQDRLPTPCIHSLEHRRDVGALVVFHKAQVQSIPHLDPLRLPINTNRIFTRTVHSGGVLVDLPTSRSCQHLRTYRTNIKIVEPVHRHR